MAGSNKIYVILAIGLALVMIGFSAVLILFNIVSITTASPHGIPRESLIPGPQFLSTWDLPPDDPTFQSAIHGEELRLTVGAEAWEDPSLADPEIYSWGGSFQTYLAHYQDFSASVMVRSVDSDPYASGCLLVRADGEYEVPVHAFSYCISEEYGLWAEWYDETQGEDAWDYPYIAWPDYEDVISPVEEWNELKIIAKGETIWMFLNDAYVGVTRHPGTQQGTIGIAIDVERDGYGAFAFRDLDIRRLGWL